MSFIQEVILQVLGENPSAGLLIILNLVIVESLLSVDNAAVLATMVMDLPYNQRSRALRYGILGAYIFRGICLLFASLLVQLWWLKPLGGAYLLFLSGRFWVLKYLSGKQNEEEQEGLESVKENSKLYNMFLRLLGGQFWATVIFVELMDLAFSIDNVLAAVAFTDNINLIIIGVFIGILSMRFVAGGFVKLLETYPFLESIAFLVIGILGLKLCLSSNTFISEETLEVINGHAADAYTSILTLLLFVVPIFTSHFFNFPAKAKKKPENASNTVAE